MNSVILSKLLYQRAVESYVPSDSFSHGLTVSLLQDSAEMLVWAMVKHVDANVKSKDGFVVLVENLDKNHGGIDLKSQIFELNSARVNFKHYGNIPSSNDIPKFINSCYDFLCLNATKIGADFKTISAFDSVRFLGIREHLKKSEEHITAQQVKEALIESSIAFGELESIAHSRINADHHAIDEIRDSYEIWPKEHQDSARQFTYLLSDMFENTFNQLSLGQFGYSPEYVLSVKNMCYAVNISVTGNILGVSNMGGVHEDVDSVKFINDFIVEASRRIS